MKSFMYLHVKMVNIRRELSLHPDMTENGVKSLPDGKFWSRLTEDTKVLISPNCMDNSIKLNTNCFMSSNMLIIHVHSWFDFVCCDMVEDVLEKHSNSRCMGETRGGGGGGQGVRTPLELPDY